MSKLLVVFAATGQQGGSVIDYVLNDSDLLSQYKLRGITRNTNSVRAQVLQEKGVEVVQADPEKPETLKDALQGAHTVFINTSTVYDDKLYEREVATGKDIADACAAAGAQYIIYSSSTPAVEFTGRAVPAFDSKYVVEEYIRTLPIKSAFYVAAAFMQNYNGAQKPRPTGDSGEYALTSIIGPDVKVPTIEVVADTGKFIGAILAEPEKYEGKDFYAASEMLTGPEIAAAIGKATGKKVRYINLPEDVFKKYLPEAMAEPFCAMLAYMNSPGYYGPDTQERVAWTQAQTRGKLTTFEEYLSKNAPSLD